MKKTRRAVLAWLLVFAFIFTGPGVGVAAATAGLREEPVAESDKDLSEIVLEDVTLDAEAKELPAQKEGLVRVGFSCEAEEVIYTVKQEEKIFSAEEDGIYLLVPGEYLLLAEREGYEPLEMPFTVETGAEEIIFEVTFPEEETAEETTEAVEETSSEITEPVEETTEEVAEPVEETSSEVTEPVEETTEEITEPVEETTEEITEPVEETTEEETAEVPEETTEEETRSAVEETTEAPEETTEEEKTTEEEFADKPEEADPTPETPFEIDEAGQPWYICPRETRTIGLFGGTDVIGAVLVNAVTGESTYYDKADIPAWVDRVFSADLIIRQYDYHGLYQNGYLNSLFGQKGCTQTTDGYNYIALNDDVYVYTGVTSVGGDESNIGFLLCNQRTKETRYYPCAGAEEFSAMDSAQGVVQHLHYVSTFPLLLNIGGQPTYFIPLKDDAALVKMYAMVNVQQYNIVATGATVAECERAYQRLLRQENLTDGSDAAPVDGVLTEIRSAVIDGTSWYYLRLQGERTFYTVSARDCETVIILSVGDRIRILGAADEGSIRKAESVELLP